MKTLLFTSLLLIVFVFSIDAKRIEIPNQQATIQAGINAASDGDTVLVAEGLYYENINFKGKAITVASHFILDDDTSHISKTVIDGSKATASTVTIKNSTDTTVVLNGLTIQGGKGTYFSSVRAYVGGGIFIEGNAKIISNYIKNNSINRNTNSVNGGGIYAITEIQGNNLDCKIIIRNNHITENSLNGNPPVLGGGVSISGNGSCDFTNNMVANNSCSGIAAANGGGIAIVNNGSILISGNLVSYNSVNAIFPLDWSSGGGGISIVKDTYANQNPGNLLIVRNVLSNNLSPFGGGINALGMLSGYSFNLVNNTVTKNTASIKGGGINLDNGHCNSINNIFWDNVSPIAPDIYNRGILLCEYCVTQNEVIGTGNTQDDPKLDSITYYLNEQSPSIDAGNPDEKFNDINDISIPGKPLHPAKGDLRADIGAFGGNDNIKVESTVYAVEKEFLYGELNGMKYRLAKPINYNSNTDYPLTVVFHGSEQSGTDNEKQLLEGLAWRINAEYFGYNEFTLLPQAPTSSQFNDLTKVMDIIKNVISQNSIDTTKIAITGWSSGALATKKLLNAYPDFFSAGIPVSGPTSTFGNIKHNSAWVFHGKNDMNVPVSASQKFIADFENTGLKAILAEELNSSTIDSTIQQNCRLFYSEINNATHFIVHYAYDNPHLFKWLKKQSRPLIRPADCLLFQHSNDSLLFQTKYINSQNLEFSQKLILEDLEQMQLGEYNLYDDGLHGDSLAQDGIWGNIIKIIPNNFNYRAGVDVINLENNSEFYFHDLAKLTVIPAHLNSSTENSPFLVYPNPTKGKVTAHFTVVKKEAVKLGIYNILGQQEKGLLNEVCSPGTYDVEVDISALRSGVYFMVLESDTNIATKLIKQ